MTYWKPHALAKPHANQLDLRMGDHVESTVDLAKFNPISANLDTIILASMQLQKTIIVDPPEVSGPHESGTFPVKVGGEPLSGQVWIAPISHHKAVLDDDLTDFSLGDLLTIIETPQGGGCVACGTL
jgi:hypothetical protein